MHQSRCERWSTAPEIYNEEIVAWSDQSWRTALALSLILERERALRRFSWEAPGEKEVGRSENKAVGKGFDRDTSTMLATHNLMIDVYNTQKWA